jgi:hypothetical protein
MRGSGCQVVRVVFRKSLVPVSLALRPEFFHQRLPCSTGEHAYFSMMAADTRIVIQGVEVDGVKLKREDGSQLGADTARTRR